MFLLHNRNPSSSPIDLSLFSPFISIIFFFICFSPSESKSNYPTIKIPQLSLNQSSPRSPNPSSSSSSSSFMAPAATRNIRQLRRLPHVFGKVLELPLDSDAEVLMEEYLGCFRYVAETEEDLGEVRIQLVEAHPGVKKLVVISRRDGATGGGDSPLVLDDMEFGHVRRVRLPEAARPEMATAVFGGGKLVVTVPKGAARAHGCKEDWFRGDAGLGAGDLVFVC